MLASMNRQDYNSAFGYPEVDGIRKPMQNGTPALVVGDGESQ
jgi:hypothetical protein